MKTILLFSATWCKACQGVDEKVKKLCDKYNFVYKYCDADQSQELLNDHQVSTLPTLIFMSYDIPYKTITYDQLVEADFLT